MEKEAETLGTKNDAGGEQHWHLCQLRNCVCRLDSGLLSFLSSISLFYF